MVFSSVLVMRHGERLDDIYRNAPITWKQRCNNATKYEQWEDQMPKSLDPFSERPLKDFADDPMLSARGVQMATAIGEQLAEKNHVLNAIYVSPSLRCIQTAQFATEYHLDNQPLIRIEPGFYGTSYNHIEEPRDWISPTECHRAGYNVDLNYSPILTQTEVWAARKDIDAYNARIHSTLTKILAIESVRNPDGNILIVGHASTPDLVTGYFTSPRRIATMETLEAHVVPYCGNILFKRYSEQNVPKYVPFCNYAEISIGSFCNKANSEFLLRK
ncbi:histidine phosphatase superfamily (branch 1) domain-containing protein [Ditylenchus destructor]|nr:histidine phosphatase superfamily (branch 1) domain-containing protein [Ditylenchus destructor]